MCPTKVDSARGDRFVERNDPECIQDGACAAFVFGTATRQDFDPTDDADRSFVVAGELRRYMRKAFQMIDQNIRIEDGGYHSERILR